MIADAKVGVDARPRPPNKAELIAAAYQALGLPSEEQSSEYGLAHFLGAVTIERNDAALDAVLELWIRRVRADLKAWRRQAPPDWRHQPRNYMLSPEKARCNFYLFHEYQRV